MEEEVEKEEDEEVQFEEIDFFGHQNKRKKWFVNQTDLKIETNNMFI